MKRARSLSAEKGKKSHLKTTKIAWVDKFWYAIQYNDTHTVNKLIKLGAKVDHMFGPVETEEGLCKKQTGLFTAIRRNYPDMVNCLIKNGCDVNHQDSKGDTPLFVAVNKANFKMTKRLIEAGADINHSNIRCKTPLHCGIKKGCTKIVMYLLKHGCQVSIFDECGYTPLMSAIEAHSTLFGRGIHTRQRGSYTLPEIVEVIIKASTSDDINATNRFGETALHLAIGINGRIFAHYTFALWLLQHGANPNLLNHVNESPLKLALHPNILPMYYSNKLLLLMYKTGAQISAGDFQLTHICVPSKQNDFAGSCSSQKKPLSNFPAILSLQDLSRIAIRQVVGGPLWQNINQLPLPSCLKDFLKMKEFDDIDDIQIVKM